MRGSRLGAMAWWLAAPLDGRPRVAFALAASPRLQRGPAAAAALRAEPAGAGTRKGGGGVARVRAVACCLAPAPPVAARGARRPQPSPPRLCAHAPSARAPRRRRARARAHASSALSALGGPPRTRGVGRGVRREAPREGAAGSSGRRGRARTVRATRRGGSALRRAHATASTRRGIRTPFARFHSRRWSGARGSNGCIGVGKCAADPVTHRARPFYAYL